MGAKPLYVVKAEDHSSLEQAILDAVEHILHRKSLEARVTEDDVAVVVVNADRNQIGIRFTTPRRVARRDALGSRNEEAERPR